MWHTLCIKLLFFYLIFHVFFYCSVQGNKRETGWWQCQSAFHPAIFPQYHLGGWEYYAGQSEHRRRQAGPRVWRVGQREQQPPRHRYFTRCYGGYRSGPVSVFRTDKMTWDIVWAFQTKSINQSINQPMNQPTDESTNQSIDRKISYAIKKQQSINQFTLTCIRKKNQEFTRFFRFDFS